jgi:hypothetical protein
MSKTGNSRTERMETDDFRFGWESAERGEPWPQWVVEKRGDWERIENQRFGWMEYHKQEQTQ